MLKKIGQILYNYMYVRLFKLFLNTDIIGIIEGLHQK